MVRLLLIALVLLTVSVPVARAEVVATVGDERIKLERYEHWERIFTKAGADERPSACRSWSS